MKRRILFSKFVQRLIDRGVDVVGVTERYRNVDRTITKVTRDPGKDHVHYLAIDHRHQPPHLSPSDDRVRNFGDDVYVISLRRVHTAVSYERNGVQARPRLIVDVIE